VVASFPERSASILLTLEEGYFHFLGKMNPSPIPLLIHFDRNVKVFLVTVWDDFENTTQRNRARTLDGAYACK
jgi:hypothetical protein